MPLADVRTHEQAERKDEAALPLGGRGRILCDADFAAHCEAGRDVRYGIPTQIEAASASDPVSDPVVLPKVSLQSLPLSECRVAGKTGAWPQPELALSPAS